MCIYRKRALSLRDVDELVLLLVTRKNDKHFTRGPRAGKRNPTTTDETCTHTDRINGELYIHTKSKSLSLSSLSTTTHIGTPPSPSPAHSNAAENQMCYHKYFVLLHELISAHMRDWFGCTTFVHGFVFGSRLTSVMYCAHCAFAYIIIKAQNSFSTSYNICVFGGIGRW